LKRGGVLNIVRHEIQVRCPSDAIPDHFEVDLTGLEIGDAVHISALKLPENVKPTITERDFTVATIVGRAADEPVAGAPTAAAAEPGAEGADAAEGAAAEAGDDKDKDKEKPKEQKKK
jgi:large subunit ribosomal protein L25